MLRALSAALVGLATGGAIVLAHGGGEGRLHGCLDDQSRVRIVGPSECESVDGFDWNIAAGEGDQGTMGPAGATGPQGPQGAPGRPGPDSRLPIRTVVARSGWTPGTSRLVTARCRAGEVAVNGGWRVEDRSRRGLFRPLQSRPLHAGSGWRVRVVDARSSKRWRLVVNASCTPRELR